LEVGIEAPGRTMTPFFQIGSRAIDLPNLNERITDRLASAIENPTAQMGDLPNRRGDRIVYNDKIVVSVAREVVGIEWPNGHFGRPAH
jgi:hypothetical protein